jgi:hypothetical protein
MILNNDEIENLKDLIFDKLDEKGIEICMSCSMAKPNKKCKHIKMCDRYGEFEFRDGAKLIVKDLFNTIDELRKCIK